MFECLNIKSPTNLIVGLFSFLLVVSSHLFTVNSGVQRVRPLIAPTPFIERYVFGYQEVVADIMWIRSIQDFDYCDKAISKKQCQDGSWLYKMLDAVTSLSPKFQEPYLSGTLALTIIITDVNGATLLFEKGIRELPNNWRLQYQAAYHYMYEVHNKERAAELLQSAGRLGAPNWVFTLAGRLYSDAGELELAEKVLQDMIDTKQDPQLISRLKDKINTMRSSKGM